MRAPPPTLTGAQGGDLGAGVGGAAPGAATGLPPGETAEPWSPQAGRGAVTAGASVGPWVQPGLPRGLPGLFAKTGQACPAASRAPGALPFAQRTPEGDTGPPPDTLLRVCCRRSDLAPGCSSVSAVARARPGQPLVKPGRTETPLGAGGGARLPRPWPGSCSLRGLASRVLDGGLSRCLRSPGQRLGGRGSGRARQRPCPSGSGLVGHLSAGCRRTNLSLVVATRLSGGAVCWEAARGVGS